MCCLDSSILVIPYQEKRNLNYCISWPLRVKLVEQMLLGSPTILEINSTSINGLSPVISSESESAMILSL